MLGKDRISNNAMMSHKHESLGQREISVRPILPHLLNYSPLAPDHQPRSRGHYSSSKGTYSPDVQSTDKFCLFLNFQTH